MGSAWADSARPGAAAGFGADTGGGFGPRRRAVDAAAVVVAEAAAVAAEAGRWWRTRRWRRPRWSRRTRRPRRPRSLQRPVRRVRQPAARAAGLYRLARHHVHQLGPERRAFFPQRPEPSPSPIRSAKPVAFNIGGPVRIPKLVTNDKWFVYLTLQDAPQSQRPLERVHRPHPCRAQRRFLRRHRQQQPR